jgi:diadenosine tetraphosphatase ApaH/serine/threonine PP2A family protein phosphatase
VDWLLKYLVISDVHANLEAFEAVLADAGACDGVLALGDFIGYGADPNAVIDRLRGMPAVTLIRGNHDKVGAGLESVSGFNHLAKQAIAWTATALTPSNRDWVVALPQGPVAVDDLVEICHGAPFDEDVYIFDDLDAMRALRVSSRPLCLFGHTHVPTAFRLGPALEMLGPPRGEAYVVPLEAAAKYLVNCGAVGQPRDGDPRAAYGILDTTARTLTVKRVSYDVGAAQAKIIAAGLPDVLAQRLAVGR